MKVTHIYAIYEDHVDDEITVVEAPVKKETPKLYWIPESFYRKFDFSTRIHKEAAHTTRKAALSEYSSKLMANLRAASRRVSAARDELDEFNARFGEELRQP